ncbi:hypothetical protein L2D14_00490 [Thalassospiraceae bacterium LMO-JJ14]|nr:hypothetical protein L2D14_00490 [Thalassospiraceae bacterium LMO-JJ14]
MKNFTVILLSLFLVVNPLMAHHAMGKVGHAGQAAQGLGMDEHANDASDSVSKHINEHSDDACSVALAHCVAPADHRAAADELVLLSSERLVFVHQDDVRSRLMPEQETPPPRT